MLAFQRTNLSMNNINKIRSSLRQQISTIVRPWCCLATQATYPILGGCLYLLLLPHSFFCLCPTSTTKLFTTNSSLPICANPHISTRTCRVIPFGFASKKIKMTSLQSLRRSLLDRMWKEVTDSNFEQRLQQDAVVPPDILGANGTIILGFDIEKADAPENFSHTSPILFKPAPRDFFQRNHIDLNGFESSSDRDHYYSLHKYRPSDGNNGYVRSSGQKSFLALLPTTWNTGLSGISPEN